MSECVGAMRRAMDRCPIQGFIPLFLPSVPGMGSGSMVTLIEVFNLECVYKYLSFTSSAATCFWRRNAV